MSNDNPYAQGHSVHPTALSKSGAKHSHVSGPHPAMRPAQQNVVNIAETGMHDGSEGMSQSGNAIGDKGINA